MKRITSRLKRLEWIATSIDILFAVIAVALFIYAYVILVEPESLRDIVDVTYHELGLTFTTAQLNVAIAILAGYMLIFIPTAIINTKKLMNKEYIEIDQWSYRTQHLHGAMAFFTFNIFSAGLRAYIGYEMKKIVVGYGFKQTMKNAVLIIAKLGKGSTWEAFGRWLLKILKNIGLFFKNIGLAILKLGKGSTWRHFARYSVDKAYRHELKEQKEKEKAELELENASAKTYVGRVTRIVVTYTFLTLMALFIVIPFYWMILTALKTDNELSNLLQPRFFIGLSEMQWVNFKVSLTQFNFLQYLGNTIFVGVMSMLGTVFTTILASFAFARLKFKGRDFIFSILLMTMMIPGELYVITNFITINEFRLGDTFAALILPFMTSVFYIFFLRQTFKQIPDTLYQAARVDGCGDFKYLTRVMLPIARPTIITIVILSAIGAWNAYIWPRLVIRDENKWLVSVALRSLNFSDGSGGEARTMFNYQLAATSIVTVPLLIIFFSLKKFIISGVGRSGTKG